MELHRPGDGRGGGGPSPRPQATSAQVSLSVVSHGQMGLVEVLLDDLDTYCDTSLEVILTLNIDEVTSSELHRHRFPITVVRNRSPKGFGANHNAAFVLAVAEHFCVINPDIRLDHDPFPGLIDALDEEGVGVSAPKVLSPDGNVEDSARRFPTTSRLLWKLWQRVLRGRVPQPDYVVDDTRVFPDWVAGMFMLFRSGTFDLVRGFDERYYLYYEDVDLCWRLRRHRLRPVLDPGVSVVHHARRQSWRSYRHLGWHLSSLVRFLCGRRISWRGEAPKPL